METKNRIPVMTLLLILINVVVYLYVEFHGSSYDAEYMIKMGAVYEPYIVQRHEYYRLITHFFLHFGFDHLFNNMISLLILGYSLEKVTGKIRFLILYFLSGILAGIVSLAYNLSMAQESVSCGASGAIYGLMGALLVMLVVGNRGRLSSEVPRYILYLAISLYSGMQDPTIDNAAHVGGFVAGAVICLCMTRFIRMEVSYES